jgi:hypothetical protein
MEYNPNNQYLRASNSGNPMSTASLTDTMILYEMTITFKILLKLFNGTFNFQSNEVLTTKKDWSHHNSYEVQRLDGR